MKKIILFYGSDRAFADVLPKSYRNLSDIAMQMDDESKQMQLVVTGLPQQEEAPRKEKKKKIRVSNFVIFADEYSSVQEHVIINFISFMAKLSITNMYIQNPPIHLQEQINRVFGDMNIIEEIHQKYNVVTEETIREINTQFDKRIIGQEQVKMQMLKTIYPIMNNVQSKPIVILLYGNSGIGKTETAQFLTEKIGGKLLRKQFSMYQNNEFANYLFGGKYNEKSFAKDLLARDSNVILLDEFDKAYSVFHSAFYQLFDEGIYEDQNYRVDVRHAIIICTSNYKSKDEVKEKLGNPIFNRFDDIDGLMITACFGQLALFESIPEEQIALYFNVNTIAVIRVIKHFYDKLLSHDDFCCGVMASIAGFMSSPFFSLYGATKAALKIFIESVNVELAKSGSKNRILNVSPGSIKGTAFNKGTNDLNLTTPLAKEIVENLENKNDLLIPQYETIYKNVLERYHKDFRKEGIHSYDYKVNNGRVHVK